MSEPYNVGMKLWKESEDGRTDEFTINAIRYDLSTDCSAWWTPVHGRIPIRGVTKDELADRGFYETPYELRKARRAKLEARLAECQAELAALIATDEA